MTARERLARLRGMLRLTREGVEFAAGLAEETHRAIAAAPLAAVPALPVARVHDGVVRGVYACVRVTSRVLFGALDRALALAGPRLAPPIHVPGPLVGLLHGIFGDRISRDRNPLRIAMQLRHRGRRLALTRAALARVVPGADACVVVFVHGLAADESCWRRGAGRQFGRADVDYGDLLGADVVPLYLRYNSGLRIPDNGRRLADLLDRLVAALPGPRRLVLVGHSMGGLVVRSACHHGRARGDAWTERVSDVVCLGAPHRGAGLERFGVAAVAALVRWSITAPVARAIDLRSAGIKDLRRGTIRDEPGDEARLPRARYHNLAGTLQSRPLAWALGDGLVRPRSAAPEEPACRRTVVAGVDHVAMLAHPEVLRWLAEIVEAEPDA